jgi:PPM family protein phosphatase
MHVDVGAVTDRGRRRRKNEDALLVRPRACLFAVADGMGGHAGGEVASTIATEVLARHFPDESLRGLPGSELRRRLCAAVVAANDAILDRSQRDPVLRGMGTTLTALVLAPAGDPGWVAHIGDSRAYRLRAGRFRRLTRDHTWVQEQVDAGRLRSADAYQHSMGNIITRALGIDPEILPDVSRTGLRHGDVLLLCTDGLTNMLDEREIRDVLQSLDTAASIAHDLVHAANARGGIDNISAVVIRAVPAAQ